MIKALLLDDEPLALRQMELYAGKTPCVEVLAACSSAAQARPLAGEADVLFVDINMPDMNGLDFVRSLVNPPLVVFTTAYSEYALEGFRVNAVGYLLKPFSLADFQKEAEKADMIVRTRRKAAGTDDGQDCILFKADHKVVKVELSRILYAESMSEYMKLYLEGEKVPLIVLYSLRHLAEQLPADRFMRVHRSYIVALQRIREASASSVLLDNGTSIPVGESYRQAFRYYLASSFKVTDGK